MYMYICSVGPLNPDVRYVVVPSQDGFVFTEIEGKPGHFRAVKLGKVVVKVTQSFVFYINL